VTLAGGLDFITDGQTVVLKPNLLTTSTGWTQPLPVEANGVTTDWRIAHAVATLVRARNPNGQILVMEGSTGDTEDAYAAMGYTPANFSDVGVTQFIPLEGPDCTTRTRDGLVERPAVNGTLYWVNETYYNADVIISLPCLKTHGQAGITGGVKNLGIGATPASEYGGTGCGRDQNRISHSRDPLADWIHDYYSIKPADFVVMDGLRGIANGPEPGWGGGDYETDRKNMRLILAARNAVALDTIEAEVMQCDSSEIGYLGMLETSGFGPSDPMDIRVVGRQVDEVSQALIGPSWACPG
jgi:uncharacterized protein (DUF362 family)